MTVTDVIQSAASLPASPRPPFSFRSCPAWPQLTSWQLLGCASPGCCRPLMYYLQWGSPLNAGTAMAVINSLGVCLWLIGCIINGKQHFFFPLKLPTLHKHWCPLAHTHAHTVISVARISNSNWMLNKAACWIIEDLGPGRVLISIQAFWT